MQAPRGKARSGKGVIADPLAAILADHDAQRAVCDSLRAAAHAGQLGAADAALLTAHVTRDLPRHHREEDEMLFPLLARCALPEDGLDPILAQLEADHAASGQLLAEFIDHLAPEPSGKARALPPEIAAKMLRYAAREQRHLALENAIVMTIARVRLGRADLAVLARKMAAGRADVGGV